MILSAFLLVVCTIFTWAVCIKRYGAGEQPDVRIGNMSSSSWDLHVANSPTAATGAAGHGAERPYGRIDQSYDTLDQVKEALQEVGLESSNLIIGVDFTKSNEWTGKHCFNGRSLHHIGNSPNPYEQAISIIGETISSFCFGFGDKLSCLKVLEVEQKYSEIRRPTYLRRSDIIKTIPDFWLTAFLSHPLLSELLTEEDQKIFKYLESVDVDDSKDVKSGYSITLNFSENPYFEDRKLAKTYSFADDGTTTINATCIKWKEGMGIANGNAMKKKGSKRPLVEESFFTWFTDTEHKSLADGVQDEVAEIIKEDLWPNPLKYFNNEVEDFDGEDDDEDGSDGEEGEEEEEEN